MDHQHLVDSFTLTKEASESSWGEDERGNWEWTREQMLPFFFFIFPSFLHFLSSQGTRFIPQASVKFPPFHHQNYFLVVWISDAHVSSWDVYLEKVFYFFQMWVSLLPCIHRHHNFPALWVPSAQFQEQYMVSWCGLPLLTYLAKKTHLKKRTNQPSLVSSLSSPSVTSHKWQSHLFLCITSDHTLRAFSIFSWVFFLIWWVIVSLGQKNHRNSFTNFLLLFQL